MNLQIINLKTLPRSSQLSNKSSNSSMLKRSNNQSCVQIKASTVIGDDELLNESNTRPLVKCSHTTDWFICGFFG
jgi:hypothetical protein